jgi:hypothetical protein
VRRIGDDAPVDADTAGANRIGRLRTRQNPELGQSAIQRRLAGRVAFT